MNNWHIFELYQRAGVYNQQRIDTETDDPISRDLYQRYVTNMPPSGLGEERSSNITIRLALVHFKMHIHLNSLMMTHFPQLKPFTHMTPQLLRIRCPCPDYIPSALVRAFQEKRKNDLIIGTLFDDDTDPSEYKELSSIVEWDFTLGMIFGCFLTRQPDESYTSLMERIKPFLFLHLK